MTIGSVAAILVLVLVALEGFLRPLPLISRRKEKHTPPLRVQKKDTLSANFSAPTSLFARRYDARDTTEAPGGGCKRYSVGVGAYRGRRG